MKIYYLLAFFIICHTTVFAQIKGVTINSKTKETIPYVNIWVVNKNTGTTSDENGVFNLPPLDSIQTIIFSSVGYETRTVSSDSLTSEIALSPTIFQLEQIVVNATQATKEITIGQFKKSSVKQYFSCGKTPWILARYFPFKTAYHSTPFLKKIKLLTQSDVKSAKILIRLYHVNKDGQPESYLYPKNIYGFAKKGKKITEIDLASFHIPFPENGFFLAVEWLIIPENKHEYNYTTVDSKKKQKGISYEPSIGTIPTDTNKNSWLFIGGAWTPLWDTESIFRKYKGKYDLLAAELILGN